LGVNRCQLNEYFVIHAPSELGEPQTTYNQTIAMMKSAALSSDINKVIEKYASVKMDSISFENGKNDQPYIIFKKNHNPDRNKYKTDEAVITGRILILNKTLDDYCEFNTKEEVVSFLRNNDSSFETAEEE
jgi:hypothetical protein